MSFVVTARKWRPQKFSEVVGQEHITTTLKNALKNNRIAHAYLFTGPRGVGKTTTARILAKTLNCLNPVDNEPCNECDMCKSIQSTQSLDIIEIDGASNRGIDEIRALRDSVKYAPSRGKYKVYIIDEVHMLTKESFNAFLKTLEEPPAHTIFIFATTDVQKVPLTIVSRCQRFDFRRIQLDTIKILLSKIAEAEKIKIDDKTLTIIAKKADGALRDAESFFDQVVSFCGNNVDTETVSKMLNLIDDEVFFIISDAILDKNFKAVYEVSNKIYENGWNFIDFMDGLVEHFRNIMTVVVTEQVNLIETSELLKVKYMDYVDKFSRGDLLRLLNFLVKTQQEMRYTQNQKLKIEISLCHLIGLERSSTLNELISNLNSLPDSGNTVNIKDQSNLPEKKNYSHAVPKREIKEVNTEKRYSASTAERANAFNTIPSSEIISPVNFDFSTIVDKWQEFINIINAERTLTLGQFVNNIKLLNLDGNKLNVYSGDSHAKETLKLNEDYITKRAHEHFGRKIVFQINDDDIQVKNNSVKNKKTANSTKEKKSDEPDPYVSAIINELGGEEIS
ncbi:MAG: DNA polymerase III subunit gamma/tau [Ignavibacteriaceae bacterium]